MSVFSDAFRNELKEIVREVIREELGTATNGQRTKPLTADELAGILRVSKATVYARVKAKKIPYLQTGRLLRFNLQAVLDSQKKDEEATKIA